MNKGGLIITRPHRKDFVYEKLVFGAEKPIEIKPLNRSISGLPVIYQGQVNSCVSCSVTFLKQWYEENRPELSWEWLAIISKTGENGASFKQVLDPARKTGICEEREWIQFDPTINKLEDLYLDASKHKIGEYFFINKIDPQTLYNALVNDPIIVGVWNWGGVWGGHAMVAYDVTEDGQNLLCANWWDNKVQSIATVPFDVVVKAIVIAKLDKTKDDVRHDLFTHILNNLKYICSKTSRSLIG